MDSIFRRICDEIRNKYPDACARIGSEPVAEVSWYFGRLEANELKGPPYIVLVRGTVVHAPPTKASPMQVMADGQSADRLVDSQWNIAAIICGRDEWATEQMWYGLLNAVRDALGGINPLLFGPAEWLTQGEGRAGYVNAGFEAVAQEFNWSVLIPRRIDRLTTIATTEHDCEVAP